MSHPIRCLFDRHNWWYDYFECLDLACVCNTTGIGVYEESGCYDCGKFKVRHA